MKPGTLIDDRFEIEQLAGRGGMGSVYRARDRSSGMLVAVKLLYDRGSDPDDRFAREVRAMASLDHPAIVRYLGHGIAAEGQRYLVTEWLDGEDLATRLSRSPLSIADSLRLAERVAQALSSAHSKGIVHRDLKPANLFLVGGDIANVKLLDFGVARVRSASLAATSTGILLGTLAYMAPEQARGEKDLDSRADVFSLGCVLFECLTGRPPFIAQSVMAVLAKTLLDDPPPVRELRSDVSAELERLVARMLSKEPGARPSDATAVLSELQALDSTAASTLAPQVITRGERHLLCVVLAPAPGRNTTGDFHEVVRSAVERFGTHAQRLADGSVLVTLAGSGAFTDQVGYAARCALALRSIFPALPLALASGHAVTGGRILAGEAIDRAARLLLNARTLGPNDGAAEEIAGVYIDEATASLLDARFEVRTTVDGLELLEEREVAESARLLLGRPSPMVGRDREMATLSALLDECLEEHVARAVLITGPAGAGKSRIRHEFLNTVRRREEPVSIWVGRGDPMSAGSPFGMIAPVIRRAAMILDGESQALCRAKLRARLARHLSGPELLRVTAFLGELIGVPLPDEGHVELKAARQDSRLMGDQMMRAWQEWLAVEAVSQPLVLVLEDLHWGDAPTVSFTDAALRHLKNLPLMVLALARPEVHEVFPRLWADRGGQEIRLGELTRRASERLVREVLGETVSQQTVERVVTLAEGNAFYLEELIRAVAEGRADTLPDTVLAMVATRLHALAPEARRMLRAASVFGASFHRGGMGALLGSGESSALLDQRLGELAEREWITARPASSFLGEPEYQFRHELVREAAYDMLTEDDRVLGHRLAAEWLEKAGEAEPMVLAEHFDRGAEPARALGYFHRAAHQSLNGNDLAAAVERAERAVACGAQGETLGALRLIQAEAECWQSRFADAERHSLEAMERLPRGGPQWASAGNFAQWTTAVLGHHEAFDRVSAAFLDLPADRSPTGEEVITRAWLSSRYWGFGNEELATTHFAAAQTLARALPAPDPLAAATLLQVAGIQASVQGDLGAVVEMMGEASRLYLEVADIRNAMHARSNRAFSLILLGQSPKAIEILRELRAECDKLGLDGFAGTQQQNLALGLYSAGELVEARAEAERAAGQFQVSGDARFHAATLTYLALILLGAGDPAGAERVARQSVELSPAWRPIQAYALAALSRALLTLDQRAPALAAAEEGMGTLHSGYLSDGGEAYLRLVHAEALAANGRPADAKAAIRNARDWLLEQAAKIGREEFRESFLRNVPENARTLDLAREWLGETANRP